MIEEKAISNFIKQINNNLLLNTSFLTNIGLFNGKTGICIYFFLLAKKTGNSIFKDYAEELIDEIYSDITVETPVDFEDGLAGIGWGIEYLVQNGFVEANTDEILEEFDNKISLETLNIINGNNLKIDKALGFGFYFLNRIKNKVNSDSEIANSNIHTLQNLIKYFNKEVRDDASLLKIIEQDFPPVNKKGIHFIIDHLVIKLLYFISEIKSININIPEIDKILCTLISSIAENNSFIVSDSNRHVFKTIFIRLKNFGYKNPKLDNFIITKLSNIDYQKIENELKSQPKIIMCGMPGIILAQYLLYKQNPTEHLKHELIISYENFLQFLDTEPDYLEEFLSSVEENRIYGILQGISGLGLIHLFYMELKEESINT